ncbi:hypothetical protein AAC387_Pa06g1489 [Persea americana]
MMSAWYQGAEDGRDAHFIAHEESPSITNSRGLNLKASLSPIFRTSALLIEHRLAGPEYANKVVPSLLRITPPTPAIP